MLGFVALMVALIGAYGWGVHKAGRLGVVAFMTALVGTMLLGGDLWFETFAVPWIADEAPASLDTDPTMVLAIGAIASYLSFAIGWALFGIAVIVPARSRRRSAPRSSIGGLLGFSALVAPLGIPIGLAIASLGVWMIRSKRSATASAAVHTPAPSAQYVEPSAVA